MSRSYFDLSGSHRDVPHLRSDGDQEADTLFRPFDDLPDEPNDVLSLRAVFVGVGCGALINASNIYVGLKSGWTTSANIFASIVGFTILKSCSKHLGHIAFLGRPFGPRENNIVQTAATAAGGMSNVFISAFPAMYQLKLLDRPQEDYWRIASLTAVGGYFGLFLAAPFRHFFIHTVGKELGLVFPSSSVTAAAIQKMHAEVRGSESGGNKILVMITAFGFAAVLRMISQYALGVFWDWHIFTWLFEMGLSTDLALSFESWGWFLEWSPAFIGSGMIVGLNVSLSFLLGTILAWYIIGPTLVANNIAFGAAESSDPRWSSYWNYRLLSEEFTTADHPSPRYWLLWPGILCIVSVAFVDLLCQWPIFWRSGRLILQSTISMFKSIRASNSSDWQKMPADSKGSITRKGSLVANEKRGVETSMWALGLVIAIVLTCIVMYKEFGVSVPESLLALVLSAVLSFVAIQASGATDVNPLTAITKTSQAILSASAKEANWSMQQAQRINLLGGALANIGANQAADLVGDFRVGFLLDTCPKQQFLAQCIGTAVATLLAPAIYILFATAYPCIHDTTSASCPFQTPAAAAWRAVAVAMTDQSFSIPSSSARFALGFSAFGGLSTLVRNFAWKGERAWVRKWHPNMMCVALPFALPSTVVGTAMAIGACAAALWARWSPRSHARHQHGVAAGLIAGEGIGGVLNAIVHVLGVSGDVFGTSLGCPAGKC